ncbi:cap-gly domain-containing protein [Ophiostoma piceae UAMH 11346]|uniref:Cap-gly domain-containing protein n=1 Tax=Ophiostoma piceae (strain UAMH 11346) TaxID=1262450 RepID=S3BU92_OPHP1|nr:cap-gly domain-containing protein [Ophiostoma piceae UAMH 11346]
MSLTTTTTTSTSTIATVTAAATNTSRLRSPFAPTTANSPARPQSSLNTYPKTPPRSLRRRLPTSTRSGSGISSKSTPNLGSHFQQPQSQAQGTRRPPSAASAAPPVPPLPSLPSVSSLPPATALPLSLPAPLLIRKGSLAALTQSSLATIPDATESYALNTLNELASTTKETDTEIEPNNTTTDSDIPQDMAPLTPSRFASSMASYSGAPSGGDDIAVGDDVDVPGGMVGTVRFVGSVNGRKGVFAGVELHPEFAVRGKNSGDVDGVSYFNTTLHGAGIFLPLAKALRRDVSPSAFPMTPSAATFNGNGLKLGNQNSTNYTPPTPSIPKFSQSVSSGAPPRAPSPQHRRPPRTSLPRPDSPVRRLQMTPGPPSRPSLSTPAPKASATTSTANATAGGGRFGSPTSTSKFSQSMRAPTTSGLGDPAKKGAMGLGMFRNGTAGASTTNLVPDRSLKASIGPRSVSALGGASNYGGDDDVPLPPLGRIPGMPSTSSTSRPPTNGSGNGSVDSASSFGRGIGAQRPSSRTAGHKKNGSIATATTLANNDEEVERLRTELDDRERQLKDQASTLADMESSLTELQTLIGSSDGPPDMSPVKGNNSAGGTNFGDELDEVNDLSQMRALLREKNDKIAMLTAEFDAHRADFRSTIDTLEMASTETERVYEKKIEEMIQEVQELESRLADVDVVAQQLKQLEELVQELEEGLEDARRGEAEARGEVEFLRGEVERTRTELRREREKLQAHGNGPAKPNGHNGAPAGGAVMNGNGPSFKDLEQKDDEIRGLKAIIHSLSQNAGVQDLPSSGTSMPNGNHRRGESINERLARESLEREVADLRALLATKSTRESEMEQEIETLRVSGSGPSTNGLGNRASAMTVGSRSSLRDSRGTVVLARDFREAVSGSGANGSHGHMLNHGHQRSNSNSNSNLRGASLNATSGATSNRAPHHSRGLTLDTMPESDAYSSVTESSTLWCEICETNGHDILTCTNMFGTQAGQPHMMKSLPPAPLLVRQDTERSGKDIVRAALATTAPSTTTSTTITSKPTPPEVKILPNPMDSGPVAGKESGVVDAGKWCALCERDGHDSVDCPFEDAF